MTMSAVLRSLVAANAEILPSTFIDFRRLCARAPVPLAQLQRLDGGPNMWAQDADVAAGPAQSALAVLRMLEIVRQADVAAPAPTAAPVTIRVRTCGARRGPRGV